MTLKVKQVNREDSEFFGNANSCCIGCKVVCYQIVIVIKGIEMAYNVGNPMFKGSLVALITPFATV